MTRHQAEKLLASFFARFGQADFAFDESTFVKARVGEAILGFDFRPDEQSLICQALIYRFRRAPLPKILRSLEAAAHDLPLRTKT